MALYVPPAFAVDDRRRLNALIDEHPFATLITPASPEPFVSHVPLLRDDLASDATVLVGHFARANPHWQQAGGVASIAIFHGPHAYVSPSWYLEPAQAVPTWNVATVHARGRIQVLSASDAAERIMAALVERFEGRGAAAWRFALQGRSRAAMLSNIVAFRLVVEQLTGKFKLSQNRPADDRQRVVEALAGSDHPESRATAQWMRRFANLDE